MTTNQLICVDASIALKLVLPEHDSQRARALWGEWEREAAILIAPTLWGYEVTSVVRNRARRGLLPAGEEEAIITTLHRLPVQMLGPRGFHHRAWELAHRFDRPSAYDAHYLALAEIVGCRFWTADERLYNAVRGALDWVEWLGSYPSPTAGASF